MKCACGDSDCEVARGVGWMCTGENLRPTIPDWLTTYIDDQRFWSGKTFGPGRRTLGITAHIRKELAEIESDPDDVREWIDVLILALDGYWRHGGKPEELAEMLEAKQRVNFERAWPAIKPEHEPVEHLR